jgi:hypothetical protein
MKTSSCSASFRPRGKVPHSPSVFSYDDEREEGSVKVWLDDERAAPEGWVHARTPEEAIELLRGGEVEELSLDHDLGLGAGARERTGYDVLLWLEREVEAGRARPPAAAMRVPSGNVGAVRRMEQAVESIRRLAGEA